MAEPQQSLLNNVEDMDFEKRLAVVQILLDLVVPVDSKSEILGTPLHLVARSNCLNVAQLLVEYGANVNEVDQDRRTPLHLCAEFSDLKMAELLLKHCEIRPTAIGKKHELPEDVNIQDFQLVKLASECFKKQADGMCAQLICTLKELIQETKLTDEQSRRGDFCSCLLFSEIVYNALTTNSRFVDWEKLWNSYKNYQKARCRYHDKFLYDQLRIRIDRYIGSWVQHAIKLVGEMKMVESSATPLHLAVASFCRSPIYSDFQLQLTDAKKMLTGSKIIMVMYDVISVFPSVERREKTRGLDIMVINFFTLFLHLAHEYKINSIRSFDHNSHKECNQSNTLQIRENVKFYVNRKDSEGYDALLKAVEFSRSDVVQLLLRNGANTCSITSQGYSALHIAVNSIHRSLKTPNPVETVNVLLSSGEFSVNALSFKAETPLHLAISNCGCGLSGQDSEESQCRREMQDSIILILLENKANVNQQDCEGMTPLMTASERGCHHIVKLLLNGNFVKVDLDVRDKYGETALIKAARMHNTEIIESLVNSGARVDLQDYRGFTALHAALHDPDEFTSLFEHFENGSQDISPRNNEVKEKVCSIVKDAALIRDTNSFKDERDGENNPKNIIIKILLHNGHGLQFETLDFANKTPFDFLVDSEIQSSKSEQEAHLRLDKMRNENDVFKETQCKFHRRWFDTRRRRESPFVWLAAVCIMIAEHKGIQTTEIDSIAEIQDNKGRTVLHYAAMLSGFDRLVDRRSVFSALLKSGCEIDARDIYQRTPLHYLDVTNSNLLLGTVEQIGMELSKQQQLIFKEIPKLEDVDEKTVEELWSLREGNAERERIRKSDYHQAVTAADLGTVRHCNGTMKIKKRGRYNFKPGISWSIWMKGIADYAYRNTVKSCLTEEIHHFIRRLANAIKRKEPCFKCQPMLVGSAFEGTKIDSPDEFDFDLILTKFSNLVEVIPSPVAPEGFVHLKKKPTILLEKEEERFFNKDGTLLTNEMNCRFQITLSKVLRDPSFWDNEHLFEWTDAEDTMKMFVRWYDRYKNGRDHNDLTDQRINPGICTTIRLQQTRTLEGQYLPNDISLDLVPCIHVDGWWPHKARPKISETIKANGCNLVFDQPQRKYPWVPFGENYARISFAPAESKVIRDSSPTAKAAYMVCKHLIKDKPQMTYILKTCLLYCIEALDREGDKSLDEETNYSSVRAEKLSLWVEKMMRCYLIFFLQDFCPCYLMPSFCLPIGDFLKSNHVLLNVTDESDYEFLKEENKSYRCSVREVYIANFDFFRRVFTRDTTIPLPKVQPLCERFDHDEFISQLRACFV